MLGEDSSASDRSKEVNRQRFSSTSDALANLQSMLRTFSTTTAVQQHPKYRPSLPCNSIDSSWALEFEQQTSSTKFICSPRLYLPEMHFTLTFLPLRSCTNLHQESLAVLVPRLLTIS